MFNCVLPSFICRRIAVIILSLFILKPACSFADENCKSQKSDKSDGVNGKGKPQDVEKHSDEETSKSHGAEEKSKPHDAEKHSDAEKSTSEEAAEVKFSADVIKKHGIEMGTAGPGVIYQTVVGPGEILLNEDKVAHVSPKVSGVAVKIFKSLGDKVSEGDILAVFESSALGEAKIEY